MGKKGCSEGKLLVHLNTLTHTQLEDESNNGGLIRFGSKDFLGLQALYFLIPCEFSISFSCIMLRNFTKRNAMHSEVG